MNNCSASLFADTAGEVPIAAGAVLLCGLATPQADALWRQVQAIDSEAPFRCWTTPGGFTMQVAMTNCGDVGWVADQTGYRYTTHDPRTGRRWPSLPEPFLALACSAAERAGYLGFEPDACLINRYLPGVRLSLHQDRDEQDFSQPIVSVSLGLPARFLFGGARRTDKTAQVALAHGDVVVWGGPARRAYHGVATLKEGSHPVLGRQRINLTFRRAR